MLITDKRTHRPQTKREMFLSQTLRRTLGSRFCVMNCRHIC
uniref:Uncharacterized protein n=1 Tax=Anguilla anguilla TaxID=7936 RepID=A0A0E9QV35_ANGAN